MQMLMYILKDHFLWDFTNLVRLERVICAESYMHLMGAETLSYVRRQFHRYMYRVPQHDNAVGARATRLWEFLHDEQLHWRVDLDPTKPLRSCNSADMFLANECSQRM